MSDHAEQVVQDGLPHLESLGDLLSTEPLVDRVYRVLRDAICDGRLTAQHSLAQIPLAEQLGISRTPVRDALQRLAQEGLVQAVSWRGFVVSEFSARDAIDIYDVRLALEPVAARAAVGRHTRSQLAHLAEVCEASTPNPATDGLGSIFEANEEFHAGLVAPCPNRILVRLLAQLWQMPASLRLFHAQAEHSHALERNTSEHRQILGAVEAGDGDGVERLVREHIAHARDETVAALDAPGS